MLGLAKYCLSYDKARLESVCSKYAHITFPECVCVCVCDIAIYVSFMSTSTFAIADT